MGSDRRRKHRIVIAGAGGIGSTVGLLLREWGEFDADIFIGDVLKERAEQAAAWMVEGSSIATAVHPFYLPEAGANGELTEALRGADILLDCLPGSEAPRLARLALEHRLHYVNLTEHVQETNEVLEMAAGAETGFLLQTGLAPGYVDVVAHGLFQDFCDRHGVDRVDSMRMRVGALTRQALPPHYYGFTWSPVGVATEYVEDAVALRDCRKVRLPSLTEVARVRIRGLDLEEGLTSGGAADLPDALEGRVRELDYKTFRHPGHYAWVQEQLDAIARDVDCRQRAAELQRIMEREIPSVEDDMVVIYAAVEGFDREGARWRSEASLDIRPCRVGRRTLRAIQSTTAAGLAEAARLLLEGDLHGPILQSQIDPSSFLGGPFVGRVYRER